VRADGSASHVKLAMLWNATTGVARFKVEYALASDGDSLNPGSLTAITSQDITVPGTARLRKDVTFDLGSAPAAGDVVIVKVTHEGAHANDTVAVNSELLGGWLV